MDMNMDMNMTMNMNMSMHMIELPVKRGTCTTFENLGGMTMLVSLSIHFSG